MRRLFADGGADEHQYRDHQHDCRRGLSHQTEQADGTGEENRGGCAGRSSSGGWTEVTLCGRAAGDQNRQDAHNDTMPHATSRLRRMSTVLKHLDAAMYLYSGSGCLEKASLF